MGLISLYKELLVNNIHKYTLQGMDENVALANTSVDWVEKVPAHWMQKRFKYIASVREWKTESGVKWRKKREYERLPIPKESWSILVTKKGLKFKTTYDQENPKSIILIDLNKHQNLNFWLFYLNSHFAQNWLRREMGERWLTVEILKNLPVFEPPISEQEVIATHLTQFSDRINQVVERLL